MLTLYDGFVIYFSVTSDEIQKICVVETFETKLLLSSKLNFIKAAQRRTN
jgi:hypothetical protein